MNVVGKLLAMAGKLSTHDNRSSCKWCGQGKLDLIDERPDPIFAMLGMTCQTLKCDFLECANSALSDNCGMATRAFVGSEPLNR